VDERADFFETEMPVTLAGQPVDFDGSKRPLDGGVSKEKDVAKIAVLQSLVESAYGERDIRAVSRTQRKIPQVRLHVNATRRGRSSACRMIWIKSIMRCCSERTLEMNEPKRTNGDVCYPTQHNRLRTYFFGAARAPEMCPDGTLRADCLVISVRYLYHGA
jgi:hypothetical protein